MNFPPSDYIIFLTANSVILSRSEESTPDIGVENLGRYENDSKQRGMGSIVRLTARVNLIVTIS
jgi:hypothetical protein